MAVRRRRNDDETDFRIVHDFFHGGRRLDLRKLFHKRVHLGGIDIIRRDDFLRLRQSAIEKQTRRYFNLSDDIDFICYPNPSSNGWVNVRFVADDNIFNDIAIYDINGKCVFRDSLLSLGGEEVSIPHQLSSGVYVLRIGPYSKKIVVM